jgi:hypothetical protein
MKKYHSFGKSALTALLVTMLVGATLGCSDNPLEDDLILQSIAVTTLPTKTVYVRGEALDISGLVVTGTYADGTTKTEPVSLANISGYNPDSVGQQTLTITVNGKTAIFIVAVNEPVLQSIAVTSTPTTTVYVLGDPLDITGLVVTGTYSGGMTKTEPVSLSDISGYDADTVGIKTLTVTVDGKQTTFTVTVNNTALQSITITSPPIKTLYTRGDPLDITGLVVTGTYADGTTKAEAVSLSSVHGYNAEVIGTQTLTVAVNNKTATFTVTVNELILQSIAVTSLPVKTVYIKGETLDITGLVVTGTYSNGMTSVAIVNLSDISGYDANTEGQQTLIVTITGKTATFTVTVNPPIGLDELADVQGGDTAANPIHLALSLDLANGGWASILSKIAVAGKYVSLDLSACTMAGTEFDPGSGEGADRVTALVLPDTAKSIKAGEWENSTFKAFTAIRSISGATIETVGGFAFWECENLTTMSLPVATTIGESAFVATSLESVSLPVVQTIDVYAFGWCGSLTTINLPASLTTIGRNPFAGCPNLTSITIDPSNTVFTFHDGMLLNKAETILIAYPSASGDITLPLPFITEIGDGAFSACYSLTSVSLPTATIVGIEAFQECMSLESVSLPAAETIGDRAFHLCGSLPTMNLPVVETTGYQAFWECESLTSVNLPTVVDIGNLAFSGCTSLESVSLPVATTIGDRAFYGCTSLEAVSLPAATTIGGSAFERCTSLESVNLPVATTIGDWAFIVTSLTELNLPAVTTIGTYAFGWCINLTTVSLPASLTTVLSNPFAGCYTLTTITVDPANTAFTAHDGILLNKAETTLIAYPSAIDAIALPSIIEVGKGAFYGCYNLISVSLPAVQTIGYEAFQECMSLTTVSLPATPPAISMGDYGIFRSTDSNGTITVSVPTGAVSAYTSAWGVNANTAAGGNTNVYGANHKAVLITDAAQ